MDAVLAEGVGFSSVAFGEMVPAGGAAEDGGVGLLGVGELRDFE
ncbi:MAG: hypothetical protein WAM91_13320 [Candidatus Acidiferrales bacterium]